MNIKNIKEMIKNAELIIITAGAGMSADSGLPTYRENSKEYENYKKMVNEFTYKTNPIEFWNYNFKFIKNILNHEPHKGYDILKDIVETKEDYFVVTSNVDGYFERAGFDKNKIYEIHGNTLKLQGSETNSMIYDFNSIFPPHINEMKFNRFNLPKCAITGDILRPNILMFNDVNFNNIITKQQEKRFDEFMKKVEAGNKTLIIEIGAGTEIPTIRMMGEYINDKFDNVSMIRVNPLDGDIKEKALNFLQSL